MSNAKIIIEEYSECWALAFQKLRAIYLKHLSDLITDVQHVGSTSVVGLAAKPIIDIDLIVADRGSLGKVIEKLRQLGYIHLGDLGIADSEAFKQQYSAVPHEAAFHSWPKHNLYVCLAGSDSLQNHISFRDFLRNNPEKARDYGNLKKRLAAENPYDLEWYVERKTPFITGVLRQVGFDEVSVTAIAQSNRKGNFKSNRGKS